MKRRYDAQDLSAAALGLLALALGAGAILGVLRPPEDGMASNVPVLAFGALISGLAGLFIGHTRGFGRQLAVIGTGIGLLAVALFGGALALEALIDAT